MDSLSRPSRATPHAGTRESAGCPLLRDKQAVLSWHQDNCPSLGFLASRVDNYVSELRTEQLQGLGICRYNTSHLIARQNGCIGLYHDPIPGPTWDVTETFEHLAI